MSDVFVLASVQYENDPANPDPAGRAVQAVLERCGLAKRRVQEVHWLSRSALPSPLTAPDFPPQTAVFSWQADGLLDHVFLQSAARSIQCGERDIVLMGQSWQSESTFEGLQAAAVLLGSPGAVGRYNLLPIARLPLRMTLPGPTSGLLAAACSILNARARAAQEAAKRIADAEAQAVAGGGMPPLDLDKEHNEVEELPTAEAVDWLASDIPFEPDEISAVFPQARRLIALPPAASGDIFLLDALYRALNNSQKRWGLLISGGTGQNGLATLVERI